MSLIFYLLLLPLAVIAAPLYIFLRSYYGWRFGIVLFVAWVASALIMPGGIDAVETILGSVISPHFTPTSFWLTLRNTLGIQPQVPAISPDLLYWLFLGGIMVWPLHFILMLIGRFNHQPPGSVGTGLSPQGFAKLGVFAGLFTAGAWFYMEGPNLAQALFAGLAALAAGGLLLALGGHHGRMLVLDKPIGLPFGSKTKSADPLNNRSAVRHGDLVPGNSASRAGLEAVFAQRPDALSKIAKDPPR